MSKLKEVCTIEEKKKLVQSVLNKCEQSANYHDLAFQMSDKEWNEYRFFALEEAKSTILAGISPNGNFNIYGGDKKTRALALKELYQMYGKAPRCLLGHSDLENALQEIPGLYGRVTRNRPYWHLEKGASDITTQVIPPSLHIRRATDHIRDIEAVKQWYEAFNEEHQSSWDIPTKEDIAKKNLYLCFDSHGNLLAGASNTVSSDKRFWVGRLYVFSEYRRKGVSEKVMLYLMDLAKKLNKDVTLLVDTNNSAALSLYKKLGFKRVGENCFWNFS